MTVYMRWIHPPSHFSGKYLYRTCLILCYSYHAFLYVQYIDQEILEYIKMCIWYNPENYDIWQPFGPGGSGYHNFYWYLHRIAFISHFCFNFSHVGFVALCTLQLFWYLHFSHRKSALLSVFFVIKYVMLIDWIWNYCCLIYAFLLLPWKIFYILWCAIIFVPCLCGRIANQLITCLSVTVFHFSVAELVWSLFYL